MARSCRWLVFGFLPGLAVLLTAMHPAVADEKAPTPRSLKNVAETAKSLSAAELDQAAVAEVAGKSEIMANLRHLSDMIGPRITGSKNLQKANEWAAARMKACGLENVKLEPWEIPVGWERGTASFKLVEPDNGRTLYVAARGWTPGTDGKKTGEVMFLKIRTRDDLKQYKGKLKDAIVLLTPPATVAPITDLRYGPPPAKKDEPAKKEVAPKKEPAKKEEAKSADAPASVPNPTGRPPLPEWYAFRLEVYAFLKDEGITCLVSDAAKPHGLLVTTGTWPTGDRGTPLESPPAVFMAHEDFLLLHRLAARPSPAKTRVEVEITNKIIPGPITVFNTVGEIRGSEKPDEFVVIGAHLDSWDLASGTTDNGTGSCVVLEVARTLAALAAKGQRPARTIRFVLFTGEEQGLYGSKEYTRRHKDEMPKTSAAVVHDTGTGKVIGLGLQGREAVKKVLESELVALRDLGFEGLTLASSGGTDHLSFETAGVPGFACRQDMDEYRLTHHTQSDTFDKAKEASLKQGAQVLAVTAMRIANLPDLLPREKPEKK